MAPLTLEKFLSFLFTKKLDLNTSKQEYRKKRKTRERIKRKIEIKICVEKKKN